MTKQGEKVAGESRMALRQPGRSTVLEVDTVQQEALGSKCGWKRRFS